MMAATPLRPLSLNSDQPVIPASVVTFRNDQVSQPPSAWKSSNLTIFIRSSLARFVMRGPAHPSCIDVFRRRWIAGSSLVKPGNDEDADNHRKTSNNSGLFRGCDAAC